MTKENNTGIQKPDYSVNKDSVPNADKIRKLISTSNHIVAFTGAGISYESGIPTYRGHGGLWDKYDPEKFASIDYFRRDPTYYWNFFKDVRHDIMANADPNPGHLALAKLEEEGKLKAVGTQNIDGLHGRAGSKRVLELHGNTLKFYCVNCKKDYGFNEVWEIVQDHNPVRCSECNDVVRPDVVLFGEMLPMETISQAEQESRDCDLMIVMGSSLVVYPAANLPYAAKMSGAKLVIINIDPTPLDSVADLVVNTPAADLLGQVVWGND